MIFYICLVYLAVAKGNIHHEMHHPQPYSFGYTINDKESIQHRQETGNGAGVVKGSYGFIDNKGLKRQVDYVADHGGFQAAVKTNEPGTSGQSPAAVHMISNDPYAHGAAVPYVSRVNSHVVPALYESDGVYGFPTFYGHKFYGPGHHHYVPSHDRHMYLTPIQDHGKIIPTKLHHYEPPMPVHLPEHYGHPAHLSMHNKHAAPHHISMHVPVHRHVSPGYGHGHLPAVGHHLSHLHGPGYMHSLSHSPLYGRSYKDHMGVVNFGANLIGGVIKGHDTRFTAL